MASGSIAGGGIIVGREGKSTTDQMGSKVGGLFVGHHGFSLKMCFRMSSSGRMGFSSLIIHCRVLSVGLYVTTRGILSGLSCDWY